MFAFSFQKQIITQEIQEPLDTSSLLARLLMIMLENQRLHAVISANKTYTHSQQVSFAQNTQNYINQKQQQLQRKQKQYQLEIQLNQLTINNLDTIINQLQQKCLNNQKQIQQIQQKHALEDTNNRKNYSKIKEQANYFKHKYQQQQANCKKWAKYEQEYKKIKAQLQTRSSEHNSSITELKSQIAKLQKQKQTSSNQFQRKHKQLKISIEEHKNQIVLKQIQISKLNMLLNDAPKLQQLNKWIAKYKECQSKQMQACDQISQMSQELCTARQKYRKLEHQHKQLRRQKDQLEVDMVSKQSNQDTMAIYFQRLNTYQKAIAESQAELHKKQTAITTSKQENQQKIRKLEQERDNAINQWHLIIDQMSKQKIILTSMQAEMDQYYKQLNQQRNTTNTYNHQENIIAKSQIRIEPSTLTQNSKCSQRSNRSVSLTDKRTQYKSNLDESNRTDQINCQQITNRQTNKSLIGRTASQQQIVYHSQTRQQEFPSRITFQKNHQTYNNLSCRQCDSRMNQNYLDTNTRARSLTHKDDYHRSSRNQEANPHVFKGEDLSSRVRHEITDEKKLLMQKLNTLKPQQTAVRPLDKSLSSIYNKSYRQLNNSSQSILKVNNHLSSKLASHSKLHLGRPPVEQKENMNDLILKKYAHLMSKH